MSGDRTLRDALAEESRPAAYAHLAGRAVTLADGTKGLLSYESWTEIAEGLLPSLADELLPTVEAECRRRAAEAQAADLRAAAAEQRAEADNVPDTYEGTHAEGHRCAADFLDRRAAILEQR